MKYPAGIARGVFYWGWAMCALDQIDSCAQLFDDMSNDPGFYDAKAFLREVFPDAQLIEIVPGDWWFSSVTVISADGVLTQVLI